MMADLLPDAGDGMAFNKHFKGGGAAIFKHACALGCEGIVSKRLGSTYRAGRVVCWIKVKNPAAPAVKREAEEDRGAKRAGRGQHIWSRPTAAGASHVHATDETNLPFQLS
jgi:hypothetical protein